MADLLPKAHVWYPLTNGGYWCQRCGCLMLGAERYLTTRSTLLVNIVAEAREEPVCAPTRDEYVDVIQRLLLYAEGSDDYAQAAVDARRLMSR